jgi:hypothetical protein
MLMSSVIALSTRLQHLPNKEAVKAAIKDLETANVDVSKGARQSA